MMMFHITMEKRNRTYAESQQDHEGFKSQVMDNIDAKYGKTANHQRQYSTMDGAGQRGEYTPNIQIDLILCHKMQKYRIATMLQKLVIFANDPSPRPHTFGSKLGIA